MAHLADSNLLLRYTQTQAPEYATSVAAITRVWEQGDDVVIVPQCLIEFWNVASRPAQVNGLGLPLTVVRQEV